MGFVGSKYLIPLRSETSLCGVTEGVVFVLKVSLNRNVLTQEIYNLLKEQILSHTLPPGDKINIDQIARDLDVSNIPIREALSRLTADGFVRMVPFKGMFVTEI